MRTAIKGFSGHSCINNAEKHSVDSLNMGHRKQQSAAFYSIIKPCSLRPEAAAAAVTAQAAE